MELGLAGTAIARCAVAAAPYAIDRLYTYRVPPGLTLTAGQRVAVPFGPGNRRSEAVVVALGESPGDGLKDVAEALDGEAFLSPFQLRLAAFVRKRYFCTYFDAVRAMIPAPLWFGVREEAALTVSAADALAQVKTAQAREVVEFLDQRGGSAPLSALRAAFDGEALSKALAYLSRKKLLKSTQDFTRRVHDQAEALASLAASREEVEAYLSAKGRGAPLQGAALRLLLQLGEVSVKELSYFTGATGATVRRLQQLGLISLRLRPVFRSPLPDYVEPKPLPALTGEQQAALATLSAKLTLSDPGVALLYGVTGSGKTAVYLHLIRRALDEGRQALYLVPEIALTPQLIQRLMAHFGSDVAVLHSALRDGERADQWKRIRQGKAPVVLGTRSSVFAPLSNLGVIIVDEEQEHSYQSEQTPRYHAREVAQYLGRRLGALVVLGSATPSVESMYLAETGVYTLCKLTQRFNGAALPPVEVVDLKEELRAGNGSVLSRPLCRAIEETVARGEQCILFLNRRGTGQYVVCVACGEVPQCPRCSVSLTYHAANGRLMCHHCGFSQPAAARCACGGHRKVMGCGTQRVEQELRNRFPSLAVARMDADTVSASNTHEDILERFRRDKIPVLVGTQMVTKGLDFENVTLVGVLDADMSLAVNHFRAAETTFSLLTQVVGRAGRGKSPGRAILQTMTPRHAVIALAARQDYDGFYRLELPLRRLHGMPPFRVVYTATFVSPSELRARRGAEDFRAQVANLDLEVLGPAQAPVFKVNNAFRYRLSLLGQGDGALRQQLAAALAAFSRAHRGVTAYLEGNSYD